MSEEDSDPYAYIFESGEHEEQREMLDPSDWNRMNIGKGGTSTYGEKKRLRDRKTVIMDSVGIILQDTDYDNFEDSQKSQVKIIIEEMKENELYTMNMYCLVAALMFKVTFRSKSIMAQDVKKFIKRANGLVSVEYVDFLRYARFVLKK